VRIKTVSDTVIGLASSQNYRDVIFVSSAGPTGDCIGFPVSRSGF